MRIQTLFGRIAAAADEQWFGVSLVLIRVAFGLRAFTFGRAMWLAQTAGTVPAEEPFGPMLRVLLDHHALMSFAAVALMTVGVLFMFGLLTRPSGALCMVMVIIADVFVLPSAVMLPMLPIHAGTLAYALLALAGGLGHAGGLNGIVLRNIRHPGGVSRALFG